MKSFITALFCISTFCSIFNATHAFAQKESSQTGLNGVTIELKGSYYAPNDRQILQETTPVIEFDGLSAEGGKQIVEGYRKAFGKDVIRDTIAQKLTAIDDVEPTAEERAAVLKTMEQLADHPEVLDFYRGIGEATGYELNDVYMAAWASDGLFAFGMQKMAKDVLEHLGEITSRNRGCTSIGFSTGIVGQNQDMPIEFGGYGAIWKSKNLIVHAPEPLFNVITMGRNVANNTNTVDAFLKGALENGVPAGAISMAIMSKAKNINDVIEALDKVEVNAAYSFTMADTSGNTAIVETQVGKDIVIDGSKRGWVVQANHPVGQEDALVKKYANGDHHTFNIKVKYTLWRQETAEAAAKYSPTKDVAALQSLFKQRPILQMPYEGNGFVSTNSIIHDLNEGCSYGTTWVPTMQDYTKVYFDK